MKVLNGTKRNAVSVSHLVASRQPSRYIGSIAASLDAGRFPTSEWYRIN